MGKTILKAILRFFLGMLGGYLIILLLFDFVFNAPLDSSTLGCVSLVTGTFLFFATFWWDSQKTKKDSMGNVSGGVGQMASQKREPETTVTSAAQKETPKIKKDPSVHKAMGITICPNCKMKVISKSDGTCPNCQSKIS
jgi:hypothetical protein